MDKTLVLDDAYFEIKNHLLNHRTIARIFEILSALRLSVFGTVDETSCTRSAITQQKNVDHIYTVSGINGYNS